MPIDVGTYGLTVPCLSDVVSCTSLQNFAVDVDTALTSVESNTTTALVRPAVRTTATGTPYTAGLPLIPAFTGVFYDTTGMWRPATPTDLIPTADGLYLVVANVSTNLAGTNTAISVEILLNGSTVCSTSTGPGVTGGQQPPNPLSCATLAMGTANLTTFRVRVTVTGVGNDNTFPSLSATLVSYGGF